MADKITIPVNPNGLADGQILVYKTTGNNFTSSDVLWDSSNKILSIQGNGNLGATDTFIIKDSDGHNNLWIKDDGAIYLGSDGSEYARIKTDSTYSAIFGYQAGYSLTTGQYHILVGYQAGYSLAEGSCNILVGYRTGYSLANMDTSGGNIMMGNNAGYSATTAFHNILIGAAAGLNFTTASKNVAIGLEAVSQTEHTGSYSVYVGYQAGYLSSASNTIAVGYFAGSRTTGESNTFIGHIASPFCTSGTYNIGIGANALYGDTNGFTGSYNIGIGYNTGYSLTTGSGNIFIGYGAGYSQTTNVQSVFIGYNAGKYYSTGSNNIGIGRSALSGDGTSKGTGDFNIGIGYATGYSLTTGNYNILQGYQAGYSLATGQKNVFIGYQAGYNETGSDMLYISNSNSATPLIKGDFANSKILFNADISIQSTQAFYFGDEGTDGTWKIVRNGDNLEFLRRESGNYVSKGLISA